MARRTKIDALATRTSILDAAEVLFAEHGVARTTLQHIAAAVGLTRGAIYWHFQDKADLFNALMERARTPLESAMQVLDTADSPDPLRDVRECIEMVFRLTATDPSMRRVFEIATHKLEFVGELTAVRERHLQSHARWMARVSNRVELGVKNGQLAPGTSGQTVALGLWAMLDGLIRIWLLQPESFDLEAMGRQILKPQLDSLRIAH